MATCGSSSWARAKIARVTTSGAVTEFPLPNGAARPIGVTAGPDGRMWFTQSSIDQIGAFTVGPGVTATDVSGVTATGATATGAVTGSGSLPTSWYFEYGTTSGYGRRTAGGVLPATASATPVSDTLADLQPGTLHHFRLVASNAAGTTYGPDTLLATQAAQTPTPTPTPPVGDDTPPATPAPVLGKSVVAGTVSGVVRFRRPGGRGYVTLRPRGRSRRARSWTPSAAPSGWSQRFPAAGLRRARSTAAPSTSASRARRARRAWST